MSEISRRQFAAYAVAVVLVVLLGGRALRADSTSADGGSPSPGAFTAGAAGGATTPAAELTSGVGAGGASGPSGVRVASETERMLVHVAGFVRDPGVYDLRSGARIEDALRKAGGGRPGADVDALNLAAKVTDGQQILVVRRASPRATPAAASSSPGGAAGSSTTGTTGPSGLAPVDVNTADVTQLELLDGVGPAIAAKILDWRTQNGPFRTVDDLAQVPGIGPKKLEAMRAQVVL